MSIPVEFQVETHGGASDAPLLDPLEIEFLVETTRHHATQHVQHRLSAYRCPTHGQPPRVLIVGRYDYDLEQFDVQYSVEGCCTLATAQAVALLSR